jgi:hypothetical protein
MSQEDMSTLESELAALGRATAYPPTPDLASGFWLRLETGRRSTAPASALSLAGVAIAAAVVAVSVVIGTVTPAREAAASLFDSINIFETDESLDDLPTDITGEETTIADAEARLGRAIEQPSYPEGLSLNRVLFQDFGTTKAAVLFYRASGGTQFAVFVTNAGVGKELSAGSGTSERVDGVGNEAHWLEGQRIVQYYDLEGNVIQQSVRVTAANTLVWDRDGYVYRIEGNVSRDEAVRIAQSMEVER